MFAKKASRGGFSSIKVKNRPRAFVKLFARQQLWRADGA